MPSRTMVSISVFMHMYTLNLNVKVPQHCSLTKKGEQTNKMNYSDINLPAVIVLKHGSVTPQESIKKNHKQHEVQLTQNSSLNGRLTAGETNINKVISD